MNVETEAIMPGIAVNTAKAAEGKWFYSIFCATWIHQCKKMRQKNGTNRQITQAVK